jgi:hypothetical protein
MDGTGGIMKDFFKDVDDQITVNVLDRHHDLVSATAELFPIREYIQTRHTASVLFDLENMLGEIRWIPSVEL